MNSKGCAASIPKLYDGGNYERGQQLIEILRNFEKKKGLLIVALAPPGKELISLFAMWFGNNPRNRERAWLVALSFVVFEAI